ncbi:hypothetical protein H632_c999p0, partial [Helicosporidium sp. ATCC 50920]
MLRVVLAANVDGAAKPLASPDYSVYHTRQGVFDDLAEMARSCPDVLEISSYTRTVNGSYSSTIQIVEVTPRESKDTPAHVLRRHLWNFGQHGREMVTTELALYVLSVLCADSEESIPDLVSSSSWPSAASVRRVLAGSRLWLVPMDNEQGRRAVERGALCERRNGRGVDPNRNYSVDWGVKEPDYDPKEEFPGTAPFSEPEAMLMLELAQRIRPHVWINVHSGMEGLFLPFDHVSNSPNGAEAAESDITLAALRRLNQGVLSSRCVVGPGGKSVGYLAHGTATDFMHASLGVPVALTWEIFGDIGAAYEDCFRTFNPLTSDQLKAVLRKWAIALLGTVELFFDHPAVLEAGPAGFARFCDAKGDLDAPRAANHTSLGRRADGGKAEKLPSSTSPGQSSDADASFRAFFAAPQPPAGDVSRGGAAACRRRVGRPPPNLPRVMGKGVWPLHWTAASPSPSGGAWRSGSVLAW